MINKIGQGGFGKVYLAKETSKNKKVVVKLNNDERANTQEYKIMKKLDSLDLDCFPKVYGKGFVKK